MFITNLASLNYKRIMLHNMTEPVISLKNVSKTYYLTKNNKVKAVSNINLTINKGEFISLMGPSGSGKSTLLNLIGLLDIPDIDNGSIFVDGHNIADLKSAQLANLRKKTIGFVFQTFNLLPRLSAWENVLLPMRYNKIDRKTRKKRATELLHLVGLHKRLKHKPAELSGGERQRVAIARALCNEPKIILADEPTGNLDSKTGEEIINVLKKLNREQGVTVIIVTHDQEIADKTDKIIQLKDGQIV